MYHIYQTHALVVTGRFRGEANRLLWCYTRELGMVYATAAGVRKEASKLRYALQDLSCADIELVRGKELWRITNARPRQLLYTTRTSTDVRARLSRVMHLLLRLLPGEEPSPQLYDAIVPLIQTLAKTQETDKAMTYEQLICIRLLFHLGYVASDELAAPFLTGEVTDEMIEHAQTQSHVLQKRIARSLRASQL